MTKESIVDASVPSAGRIYDYLLGGHHNFEVDRQAANGLLQMAPFLEKMVRLQRWCLQDIAHELTTVRGYDTIIDFASGLPTQDHLHFVVPPGTKVIYSDYDPVVVEYAREIIGNAPDVYFFEADARHPEGLLNRTEVQQILGGKRDVALIYWGVSAFINDEQLLGAARFLYDWCGERSCWAVQAQGAEVDKSHSVTQKAFEIYRKMGTPVFLRSLQEFQSVLRPWHADGKGFISLLEWHGLDTQELTDADLELFGSSGAGFGAYLVK